MEISLYVRKDFHSDNFNKDFKIKFLNFEFEKFCNLEIFNKNFEKNLKFLMKDFQKFL